MMDWEGLTEIEAVVGHRKQSTTPYHSGTNTYQIKWLGYGPEENSWVAEDELHNARDVLTDYWQRASAAECASEGIPFPAPFPREHTSHVYQTDPDLELHLAGLIADLDPQLDVFAAAYRHQDALQKMGKAFAEQARPMLRDFVAAKMKCSQSKPSTFVPGSDQSDRRLIYRPVRDQHEIGLFEVFPPVEGTLHHVSVDFDIQAHEP
ncbi:hypothetical protein LTR08_003640 [Meristemomyces frigidus]|nr:hypothetical protein LTR08_003640 [Meristemomyces frigidus]